MADTLAMLRYFAGIEKVLLGQLRWRLLRRGAGAIPTALPENEKHAV
jgi:hypothetical protein